MEDKIAKLKSDETAFGIFCPIDYIIAPFESQQDAAQAARALRQAGFAEDDVLIFTPQEVLQRHEHFSQNADAVAKVKAFLSNIFGDESNYVEQYVELAHKGYTFTYIYAPDEGSTQRASNAIKPLKPHRARKYDSTTITDITFS